MVASLLINFFFNIKMGKNNHRQNNNNPTSHPEYTVKNLKASHFNLYQVREKRYQLPVLNKTIKIIKRKRYSPLPNFNKLINLQISCNSKILTFFPLNNSHSKREEMHVYPLIPYQFHTLNCPCH